MKTYYSENFNIADSFPGEADTKTNLKQFTVPTARGINKVSKSRSYHGLKIMILFLFILCGVTKTGWTQPQSEGPLYPGLGSNVISIGTEPWNNPTYIYTDNNNNAYVNLGSRIGVHATSNYLWATNFGFNIPTGATILGIQVTIGKFGSGVLDNSVTLVNGGTVIGIEKASGSSWSASETPANYGGPSDLWGAALSPSDINSNTFGAALSAKNNTLSPRTASVDYFTITVTYNCDVPSQPGTITGSSNVCPGTAGLNYSISSVSGATSYTWSVPSGWSITSGQGTVSITTTSGTTGGDISVTADNSCGASLARTLPVTVWPAFSAGGINTTGQTICSSSSDPDLIGSLADASGGDGSITYQWQYSTDAVWTSPQTIPGSNSVTYDPPAGLTENRWYRRQAHDGTCSTEFVTSTGVWQVTILPEFSPGAILTDGEAVCFEADPGEIGSAESASGGDGNITYQWQYSADAAWTSPQTIPGSNSLTYDPPAGLAEKRWYRRQAHDGACNTEFVSSAGEWLVSMNHTWTGTVDDNWNNISNWSCNVVPTAGTDVTIPSAAVNQPFIQEAPLAECNNLIIESGAYLAIDAGQGLTVSGTLSNSGTLYIFSGPNGHASLIAGTYTRETGGTEYIEMYLGGGSWHYISSPVNSLSSSTIGTPDLAAYYECRISSNQDAGWIAYDGYVYSSGDTEPDSAFSDLSVGHGYDYYNSNTNTVIFDGLLNTSGPEISLAYNSKGTVPDYPDAQGFNLLGNPFTSCLDWDQIALTLSPSISQAIYFTHNGSFASYVNGVGTNDGTGTIPSMQGFFVKTYAQGTSVNLDAGARVHNTAQISYKGGSEVIPLVRLKFENSLKSDEAVIRFDEKATDKVDNLFDAYKFSQTGNGIGIWTMTGNVNYSINGLPFPETKAEIPVGIYNAGAENSKITGAEIDGLDDYNVTLTDKLTNTSVDLKKTGYYSFQSQSGIVTDRFVITVTNISTDVPETSVSDKPFNIYSGKGSIYIQSLNKAWEMKSGSINVYDLYGRRILQKNNIDWSEGEIKEIPLNASNGIYFVEIKSKINKFIGKISFNK